MPPRDYLTENEKLCFDCTLPKCSGGEAISGGCPFYHATKHKVSERWTTITIPDTCGVKQVDDFHGQWFMDGKRGKGQYA